MTEALIACVDACKDPANPKSKGSKIVGPLLWPEKTPDDAQRLLLDCLNDDRPAKLSPAQVLFVFRLARARGCHVGMQFMAAELGYAEPVPVDPRDEAAELQRQFINKVDDLKAMCERISILSGAA